MGHCPAPSHSPYQVVGLLSQSEIDSPAGGLRAATDRCLGCDWDRGNEQGGELHSLTGTVVQSAPSWKRSERVLKPLPPTRKSLPLDLHRGPLKAFMESSWCTQFLHVVSLFK